MDGQEEARDSTRGTKKKLVFRELATPPARAPHARARSPPGRHRFGPVDAPPPIEYSTVPVPCFGRLSADARGGVKRSVPLFLFGEIYLPPKSGGAGDERQKVEESTVRWLHDGRSRRVRGRSSISIHHVRGLLERYTTHSMPIERPLSTLNPPPPLLGGASSVTTSPIESSSKATFSTTLRLGPFARQLQIVFRVEDARVPSNPKAYPRLTSWHRPAPLSSGYSLPTHAASPDTQSLHPGDERRRRLQPSQQSACYPRSAPIPNSSPSARTERSTPT